MRSAAGCGRSSATRAPAGDPAALSVKEPSVPVGEREELAPPPPWLWRRSSVPVRRRTAATPPFSPSVQHCGGVQLPEPCGRSAVRVPEHRTQPPLSSTPSSSRGLPARISHEIATQRKRPKFTNLSEPRGGGGCGADQCVSTRSLSITLNKCT